MLIFNPVAKKDIEYWRNKNANCHSKIFNLLDSIKINPFEGIGKPERLKGYVNNRWSRHIDKEHRLVYEIHGKDVIIISARYHY